MEKYCPKCKNMLPVGEFHKNRSCADGVARWCKSCRKSDGVNYRKRVADKSAEKSKVRYYELIAAGVCPFCRVRPLKSGIRTCEACALRASRFQAQQRAKLRLEVFNAYGGPHCQCCGEDEILFLTIDHINDDGAAHRKTLPRTYSGGKFYKWLKRNKYPSGFRVLCFNCNCGRQRNGGVCPHHQYAY